MSRLRTTALSLFHTSSEVEPRSKGVERQYLAFLKYCRTGLTTGYAESWADAEGRHGGIRDKRWCSPCQWNYWRLLCDLNCGISFIAVYGSDLARSKDPQFRDAFEFAAEYAGYHASPGVAPGAWIAFREGHFLCGNYTFLMRLAADSAQGEPLQNAGPSDQRYGAWARRLSPGQAFRVRLNPVFAASLKGTAATLRITYLDKQGVDFSVTWQTRQGNVTREVKGHATGRWQQAEFSIANCAFDNSTHADIEVRAEHPVILHMIEVRRSGTHGQPVRAAN